VSADACPRCGEPLEYDEADIGVGTIRGNPGCPNCFWTPDEAAVEEMVALIMKCPNCGAPQEDHDGFGVLSCAVCGYCTHPSLTGGVCDICHKKP
jgi:hypothetical protein